MNGICQSRDAGVDLVEIGGQRKNLLLLCGVQNGGAGDESLPCTGVQVAEQHLSCWAVDCSGELGSVDAIDVVWHVIRRYAELSKVVVDGGQGSAAVVAVLNDCVDDKGLHIQACVLGNVESSFQTTCSTAILTSVTHQVKKRDKPCHMVVNALQCNNAWAEHDRTAALTACTQGCR